MDVRSASHAGSWYSSNGIELSNQLESWLNEVDVFHAPARAIVAPHAGYRYSGPCSAYAYKQIDPSLVKRVFILGPSHFHRFSGCALSAAGKYETPLYDLPIDTQVVEELSKTKQFQTLDLDTEETEHSIEMHLPYIAKAMEEHRAGQFAIVPVLVGSLSSKQEASYGQIFAKYLVEPDNLFVISSDFCHWGKRFSFTHYDESYQEIYQSIENLDKMGMKIIEELSADNFAKYLKEYRNTICGRNPIMVLLRTVQDILGRNQCRSADFKFLKYAQSQQCRHMNDSSVSYAAGSLVLN